MKRIIALVGRPNVGKSTLFNRLTRSHDALVAEVSGLTRDRRYGRAIIDERIFVVVDTGGLSGAQDSLDQLIADQAMLAMKESDAIVFVVDVRAGVTAQDQQIAIQLRKINKPVILVVNKAEGMTHAVPLADFFTLPISGEPLPISAAHGEGIDALRETIFELFKADEPESELESNDAGPKVAIVGRPNVGKSTLVNRLLGEERVLALDMPGTTRDSISIPFTVNDRDFTLIDTAGVRRRGKISDKIEKFSVIKTLQAIDESNAVIMVLDAHQGISAQDASLLGYVVEAGKALLVAVNKWDGLDTGQREFVRKELDRKLSFADYASIHFISALHGTGVGLLMDVIWQSYESSRKQYSASKLTQILEDAIATHQPPLVQGRRIKLRYAHQGGQNPTLIVIHGNQTERVPESYRRFLMNIFRKTLKLEGSPIKIDFKTGDNPFKDRKNTLTKRQIQKKKRLVRHVKKK